MSGTTHEADTSRDQEITAQLENTLIQTIDIEKINAVPEHERNIQKLIERYGDNPESCPFIKSMGAAGVELVQRLSTAEKEPERGPTMRELMEARKQQAKANESVAEKPKQTEEIQADTAKVQEIALEIQPEVKDPAIEAASEVIIHEQLSKAIKTTPPRHETPVHQKETHIDVPPAPLQKSTKPKQPSKPHKAATENIPTKPAEIIDSLPENEPIQNIEQEVIVTDEVEPSPIAQVFEIVEAPPVQETTPKIEHTQLTADIPAPNQAQTEHVVIAPEAVVPKRLEEILDTYIQSIESNEDQAERPTVDQLIEVIQNAKEHLTSEVLEKAIEPEEITQIVRHLREVLGPKLTEAQIKKVLRALLTPNVHDELNTEGKISIDTLNYMGTHEHKLNSTTPVTMGLLKAIKDTFEPHIRIGKFALQTILA